MATYDRLGRRQEALAQYQRLRAALRSALEADPAAETRALYRELLAVEPDSTVLEPRGLPAELTTFIGREQELAAIAGELGQTRLLTLTGPGGSGKTRLAVAAAARAAEAGRDAVVFVDLGPITDPELVGDAAADAFGFLMPAKSTAADSLAAQIAGLRALVVLDTCEHLVDACAALAEVLLTRCPELTILATSRERLRAAGERAWPVPGLSADEALELFLARARDADPSFAPTGESIRDVEALCARLDGMPLALEMAAARVPAFSPSQITARLDQSIDILADGRRTALSRQQTLRATIDWSHDLLDGEERVLFRRLAVFSGSFSLEAAEHTCAGGAVTRSEVVTLLLRIVEKSLAVVEDAELARYRLADTVRQFGAEQLVAAARAGGGRDTPARVGARTSPPTRRPSPQLELDHDNIRAALDSGLRSDPQGALRLAAERLALLARPQLLHRRCTPLARGVGCRTGGAIRVACAEAPSSQRPHSSNGAAARPRAWSWPPRRSHSPAACARSCWRTHSTSSRYSRRGDRPSTIPALPVPRRSTSRTTSRCVPRS